MVAKYKLLDIRKKHYENNKHFYRLFSEQQIKEMDRSAIIEELIRINEFNGDDGSISTDLLKEKFSKFNSTRHIQSWHDGSCISNHSHLNILYDSAIHITDKEYKQIYGKDINVQSVIEKPYLYILARCPGDNHQLMYEDCRNEDIKHLAYDYDGIKIKDVRFFHGDGPSCQMESGQQKMVNMLVGFFPANFDIINIAYVFFTTCKY